jgi:23S rRNA pseudouridine2605 synthase
MRINQFLARYLGISRRQADVYVVNKKIKINGENAQLFSKIDENTDLVEILENGIYKSISLKTSSNLLFYKPIFCLTTRFDPQKRKTIYNFLPKKYHNLKSAGRLDYMSEGLLVMSLDGNLIQDLTHPRNEHHKTYLVALNEVFKDDELKKINSHVTLENYELEEMNITLASIQDLRKYEYLKLNTTKFWYFFTLTEGRNQQIRKVCQLFNKKVLRLIRTTQGNYVLTKNLYDQKILEID